MGRVDIKDRVTIAQFNKLRQSMKEKQERLTQDLQNLMTEIRRHRPPHDGASNHSGDREDSDGRRGGQRNQRAAYGRGRRHSPRKDDESEDEADDNRFQLSFGRRCHRRGNHEERFGKLKFTMPKFAAEPSTRNFSGGSKSITKFAAELSTMKDSSGGSRSNF